MRVQSLASLALLASLPTSALGAGGEAAQPFTASRDSGAYERSLECLSQAIYYEARSQSEDGQRAVAQVVLNRVRHPAFPASVCGVVYQGSERSTGCQFTFTCDGSMTGTVEPYAWERARRIAAAALGGSVYRPVGLATNYHTTAIHPYWAPSLVPQVIVGAHIFYRRPGSDTVEAFSQAPSDYEPDIAAPELRYAVARAPTRAMRARFAPAPIMEIPVVERPVLYRTLGGGRQTATPAVATASVGETGRPAARRAATRSAPRVQIQGGVRIFRGS